MGIHSESFEVRTQGDTDVLDITAHLRSSLIGTSRKIVLQVMGE